MKILKAIKNIAATILAVIVAWAIYMFSSKMYKNLTKDRYKHSASDSIKKEMKEYEAFVRKTDKEDLIRRYKEAFGVKK